MKHDDSKKMFYVENISTDPRYNLALEEYVFTNIIGENRKQREDIPILLLWQNEPSVIIGKFQNTIEEINYDYIKENKIHVVRRNSGGGAVYHDLGNLNYSFIIPNVEEKVNFKPFTIPLIKALRSQGLPVEQTGRNDIVIDGKKFSGNAQQFAAGRLLHHGTIMFDVDTEAVVQALQVKAGKFKSKAIKSVKSRVTNLKPYFEEKSVCNVEDFKEMLMKYFSEEYQLIEYRLTKEQLEEVNGLKASKYDKEDWNFGKSPKADVIRGDFFRCGQVEFHFNIENHKIKLAKIVGDFFSSKDIADLENMLIGCEYTEDALRGILSDVDLAGYFGDVTVDELIQVIV